MPPKICPACRSPPCAQWRQPARLERNPAISRGDGQAYRATSGWMPSDDQSGLRQSACPCKYRKVPPIRKRRLPFAPDRPSACAMAQPFAAKNTSKIRHTDQLSPEIDYFCSLALVLPCCHVCPKNDILAAFLPILPRSFPACKKQFSPSSFPPVPDPCPAERLCFLQPQGRGTSGPYGFAQDESA